MKSSCTNTLFESLPLSTIADNRYADLAADVRMTIDQRRHPLDQRSLVLDRLQAPDRAYNEPRAITPQRRQRPSSVTSRREAERVNTIVDLSDLLGRYSDALYKIAFEVLGNAHIV